MTTSGESPLPDANKSPPALSPLDAHMHELILSFTGYRLPATGDWRLAALAEHKAIEARDPNAASEAIRHHLNQLITLLEPLIARHAELFSNG